MLTALAGPAAAVPAADAKDPSVAAFLEAVKVLNHPRCMNCHTTANWPTQGEDQHRHTFSVVRGPDGRGPSGMRCANCHQAMSVPGAKDWRMAPLSMGWTGLSAGALCAQLSDPKQNGGRTGEKVIEHVRADALVLWAWTPGGKRKPPDLPHKAFVAALQTWLDKGAHCPAP